ncbi:MAG: zinc-binding dehydrogenase, partial [Planctomycetota bacterium]
MTSTADAPTQTETTDAAATDKATSKDTMTAVYVREFGEPEDLKVEQKAIPEPGANEILIDVAAAGVNFADVIARQGFYRDAPPRPFVPGYEVAGIVSKLGEGVTKFKVGQRVVAITDFWGYAEKAVANEAASVALEDGDDFVEAAALLVNAVTAWHCMFRAFSICPGDRVLVHAAAGGVGLIACQMAKHAGATVFGTAGGPKKVEYLKNFGVDHPIDYKAHDFEEEIKRIAPEGVDLILDSIGGSYHKKGRRILRPGGSLMAFGMASMNAPKGRSKLRLLKTVLQTGVVNPLSHMMQSKGYVGVNMKRIGELNQDLLAHEIAECAKGWRAGHWKPVLAKTFPLEQAAEAH